MISFPNYKNGPLKEYVEITDFCFIGTVKSVLSSSINHYYLVKGDAQCTVAASYTISPSAVSRIITENCDAIWTSLKRMHCLDCPSNVSKWKSVTQEFESKWNFPHRVGALDGKHVVMQAPYNSGSAYFNYKKTLSMSLQCRHWRFWRTK